jgi:hypothetical protein
MRTSKQILDEKVFSRNRLKSMRNKNSSDYILMKRNRIDDSNWWLLKRIILMFIRSQGLDFTHISLLIGSHIKFSFDSFWQQQAVLGETSTPPTPLKTCNRLWYSAPKKIEKSYKTFESLPKYLSYSCIRVLSLNFACFCAVLQAFAQFQVLLYFHSI